MGICGRTATRDLVHGRTGGTVHRRSREDRGVDAQVRVGINAERDRLTSSHSASIRLVLSRD